MKGYEVSNRGQVRSANKTLSPIKKGNYYYVNISRKHYSIHSLVAEAFLGYSRDGKHSTGVVNHKDRDTANNALVNLEVVSQRANSIHTHSNRNLPHNIYPTKQGKHQVRASFGSGINQCNICLGTYDTVEEALAIRDKEIPAIEQLASEIRLE